MNCSLPIDDRPETVSGYCFQRADLRVADRRPGISAFMRIRNGADFLELTIRSHIDYFDELVAVYNQSTDETPDILMRLQREFGPTKLRVIHYTDRVFPPGSDGHARTLPTSPNSLINYYNFSLAATRYQFATKLDDDHLAIADAMKTTTDAIRAGTVPANTMHCFSGLNVFRQRDGRLGILDRDPISGGGDIGFFRVSPRTYFKHDRRFERFERGGARRCFAGFLYWHLKYIKADMGFGNYELAQNPSSRYAKRQSELRSDSPRVLDLKELAASRQPRLLNRLQQVVSEKWALAVARDTAIRSTFPDANVADAIARTVSKEFTTALVPSPTCLV